MTGRKFVSSWIVIPFVAIAVVFSAAVRAEAQGIGVKGGVLFPDFRAANIDLNNKTGWQAGLFFGGNRPGIFGFQIEVNYLRQETDLNGLPPNNSSATIQLDYIQVPLLLRMNIGTKSKNKFAIYGIAGPSIDAKVRERITAGGQTTSDADVFLDYNISLLFGGGVEISRIIIEGRYAVGLKVLDDNDQFAPDLKVNSFAVLAGIRFN
jgi:hypothetical protein